MTQKRNSWFMAGAMSLAVLGWPATRIDVPGRAKERQIEHRQDREQQHEDFVADALQLSTLTSCHVRDLLD